MIVLSVLLVGSGIIFAATTIHAVWENNENKQLKAENQETFIQELFHDQGHIYMTPLEPKVGEEVTIRLRSVRYNLTRAQIQYTTDKGVTWKTEDMKFEKSDDTGYYDLWKGTIPAEGDSVYYRFIVGNEDLMNTVYYDLKGVSITEGKYDACWQFVPGHDVPEWAKGTLWYSLMPDAFYNGNTTNDKQNSGKNTYVTWNKLRKDLLDKYGGDLDGIETKLDYIESLNVDSIFMNPTWKAYQNAGYGQIHFDEVESSFGNEEDLVQLSDAIHDRGMRLMGDVVLTFAVADSYYFNKNELWPVEGAYQSEESQWAEMFEFYNWPDHYLTGWGSPSLNLSSKVAKDLIYNKQDSYLLKYAPLFDGYRFDCGGWLWGTTDTDDVETAVFVNEIRDALRTVDEDFYVLTESDWDNMRNGTWDSAWNIAYMPKLQDYAKGLINETLMTEAMCTYERNVPRNVALCLQNMMCSHDSNRVVQEDDYMYNAAVLLQMTYLGAPSIYYGEETNYIRGNEQGIGSLESFYAMDWDESNWDMDRLSFYKATTELRKEYSCVKTGVVNLLGFDDANNTIQFGRWDENGAAITITSQNDDIITMEIPVNKCDIKNGTIMTDWYTGKQYKVEDGKIIADIIPGGTVIVTGKKSSTYRQTFELARVGNVSKRNRVETIHATSFSMEGKGKISGSKDNITFTNVKAYDNFSVYANLRGDGAGSLLIRNTLADDDLYYGAIVRGKKLSIVARTAKGEETRTLAQINCTKDTYVKLVRNSANQFTAYQTEVSDGVLGEWTQIKAATISLNMNNQVFYGFAPLKDEMRINNITFEQSERELFDTFNEEVSTGLFDNLNADFVTLSDGHLVLQNDKVEDLNYLLTNSMDDDWTFKTKLKYTAKEDEYAGVISYQDENNYVIAGKTMIDDKEVLFLGKATNGSIAMYDIIPAPTVEEVIIQLQRIGAYYSAVYSVDGGESWNYIGKIYTNYCVERVGIMLAGKTPASFDWVSFGDSITDGVSVNTPQTPIDISVAYTNDETSAESKFEYLSGEWELVTGGWEQKDKTIFAQASTMNKMFYGVNIEATLEITDGDGWAGINFGKATPYTETQDGYYLKYYKDGTLKLTNKDKTIGECKLNPSKNTGMRVVVEASEGTIIVYAGQTAKPVISLRNTGYYNGYASFCTEGAAAKFGNFNQCSTSASWSWISGNGVGKSNQYGTVLTTTDASTTERQIHSIGTLVGHSFTNFVCTSKLSVIKKNKELACASGLLLCASEGQSATTDGVFVYLDGEGKLVLSVDGIEKESYVLPSGTSWVTVMVVKQNGVYKVFLEGENTPVLEYQEAFNRGGVFSVYTINGSGTFLNVNIENLQPQQDYTTTKLAKEWNANDSKTFVDDFQSQTSEDTYYYYNTQGATFAVTGGSLRCYDASDWSGGATIATDTYSDFRMEFKLRIDGKQTGWMSVGMRKNKINADHNNAGISLMISSGGSMFFISSVEKENVGTAIIKDFEVGQWYDIKIEAKEKNVVVYVNGNKMTSFVDEHFSEGFISFTSGMHNYSVDDLKITPIE